MTDQQTRAQARTRDARTEAGKIAETTADVPNLVVLGIESTAHTLGIAVLRGREVLANERAAYTTASGGMIPAKVAQHHGDAYAPLVQRALEKANISLSQVQLVAYSDGPGLGASLRIGAAAARSLALQLDVPLIGVNHCIAHLEIARLVTDAHDPVLLYCSGANTQVIAYDAGKYRVFGETLDTGVGNFLDTLARNLGLGFPGGPKIEQLALRAAAVKDQDIIELPYTVKGMDVSFAGLETNLLHKIQSNRYTKEMLAHSAQEHVFAMLVEVAERALAHVGKKELVLGGGVACNKRLQEMCRLMCEERGARFFCPANEFLIDNAAMIAWTGLVMRTLHATHTSNGLPDTPPLAPLTVEPEHAGIKPYERTDDVHVTWR